MRGFFTQTLRQAGLPLLAATALTLLPALYAILQARGTSTSKSLDPNDPMSSYYERT